MTEPISRPFKVAYRLDCMWQLCPVPILMTEEKIRDLAAGEVLEVVYTDRGVRGDLGAWCRVTGHELLAVEEGKLSSAAYVRKK